MKWFGQIAFSNQSEVEPGVWEDEPVVRDYYGTLNKVSKKNESTAEINQDIAVTNTLSVIADPFLLDSFQNILYVTFGGAKWKVSSVSVGYPELTLTFGDLYREESTE